MGVGNETVSPNTTTTYSLRVVAGGWDATKKVTIEVVVPAPAPTNTAPPPPPALDWVEAENGDIVAPMVIGLGSGARGGQYVHGVGGWDEGSVTISLSVPSTGDYHIECRIKGPDWNQDSMYVRMDGGAEIDWRWQGPPELGWHKEKVIPEGSQTPTRFHLSKGTHRVRFRVREAGARLDAVRLVKVN